MTLMPGVIHRRSTPIFTSREFAFSGRNVTASGESDNLSLWLLERLTLRLRDHCEDGQSTERSMLVMLERPVKAIAISNSVLSMLTTRLTPSAPATPSP